MTTSAAFQLEYRVAADRWRKDPAAFVGEIFGVTPDAWQVEALSALADGGRVSIRACHGPGKSALDAWAVFWFMSTRFPARVPCTAPTAHQLEDILWSEIAKWYRISPGWFQTMFRLTGDRLEWQAAPRESFAVARTARKEQPEALQGFHCENLLFVLDEASGIEDVIFEVAEGALSAENACVLMTANPTRTSGYFHSSHHGMRHRWHTMRISHTDSPRVSAQYAGDMAAKWGVDSNVYRVRVLGEFPRSDDDAVIPLELCEAAVGREVDRTGTFVWGLDVARFGADRTALAKRCGNTQTEPVKSWRGKDTMQTAGLVVQEWDATPERQRPLAINVDVIGLGAGVVDRLKEQGLPAVGVNVAEQPASKERFLRLRDELWFQAREWLEARDCVIADDDELIGELSSLKYKPLSSGKLQVEGKDDAKKRGVQSPDLADAFCLTFARGGGRASKAGHWRPIAYDHRAVV